MDRTNERPEGPTVRVLLIAMVGWAGLAACLTMVFYGMRAVMDIGGSCAEGGPYVIAQPCPEGSTPALFLGIFGGLAFAFVASVGGFGLGGIWAATPILAWSALFGSLGWNFMEYGLFAPPDGEIVWGWLIPGLMFWAMAAFPLLALLPAVRGAVAVPGAGGSGGGGGGTRTETRPLTGPGQPARRPVVVSVSSTAAKTSAATATGIPEENREELARIAADFGAAIGAAMAETPVDPEARPPAVSGAGSTPEADFTEGTQALLDRLERLADMRDRGLLGPEEYETAKAAIMTELEGRT